MAQPKTSYLSVTDQFCGAGGSSLGASAAGTEVILAMNHWELAIETHNTNFPRTDHVLKVTYGEHERVLRIVDDWLIEAEITGGRVFPISTRTVQRILSRYPLYIDGEERRVQPHDLRRTYARRFYEAGVDLAAIQHGDGPC